MLKRESAQQAVPVRRIEPVGWQTSSVVSAAGFGLQALAQALQAGHCALQPNRWTAQALDCYVGQVDGLRELQWPAAWAGWDCRANRLAWLGLQADGMLDAVNAAGKRWGRHRVGLVLGSAASTIGASEAAYRGLADDGGFPAHLRQPALHSLHGIGEFVQAATGLQGPSLTVSTACSSSAKAFAVAQRWLALDLVDAVLVGGVDALCDSMLFGFHALQLLSTQACQPFAEQRSGISIGEAAAFVLLKRGDMAMQLLGHGEATDAFHMSSPHPQGLGAELALDAALARAGAAAHDIDFVQLHGTGTALNDAVEAALVARRLAPTVHASAIKGCVGHTMGAAGILGVLACQIALQTGHCAGTVGLQSKQDLDSTLPRAFAQQLQLQAQHKDSKRGPKLVATHAFGFGGNNAVLLLAASQGAGSDQPRAKELMA